MKAVRVFARFQHAIDPRTEVPLFGLLPYRPPRLRPYLYTDEEIRRLLEATARLRSTKESLTASNVTEVLTRAVSSLVDQPEHDIAARIRDDLPLCIETLESRCAELPMLPANQGVSSILGGQDDCGGATVNRLVRHHLDV
jgi:hypothetical protein